MARSGFEVKLDNAYNQLSYTGKIITVSLIGILTALLVFLIVRNFMLNSQLSNMNEKYKSDLAVAKDNYYLLNLENANLEKKVQDLNLKLVETINNTVDLQVMMDHVSNENTNLVTIKDELIVGLKKTNQQLLNMQSSVNKLINSRTDYNKAHQNAILGQKGKLQ